MTYADMVTLLMVLFIVMFAMSQVDEKKFNALKDGLAAGFGQSTSVMTGLRLDPREAGLAAAAPSPRPQSPRPSTSSAAQQAAADAVQQHEAAQAAGSTPRRRRRSTGSRSVGVAAAGRAPCARPGARRPDHDRRARPGGQPGLAGTWSSRPTSPS